MRSDGINGAGWVVEKNGDEPEWNSAGRASDVRTSGNKQRSRGRLNIGDAPRIING